MTGIRRGVAASLLLFLAPALAAQDAGPSGLAGLIPDDYPLLLETASLRDFAARLRDLPAARVLASSPLSNRLLRDEPALRPLRTLRDLSLAGTGRAALALHPGGSLPPLFLCDAATPAAQRTLADILKAAGLSVHREGNLITSAPDVDAIVRSRRLTSRRWGRGRSLGQSALYQASVRRHGSADLHAFLDLDALLGLARGFVFARRDPFGPLLLGPLLEAARTAPFLSASLRLDATPALEVRLPHAPPSQDTGWTRAAAVGPDTPLPDLLARFRLGRHLADWWRVRDTLTASGARPGLAEFENGMNLVFGDMPFLEILDGLGPGVEILVTGPRRLPDQDPAEVHPAFAVVLAVTRAEAVRDRLQLAFQNLVSILNLGDDGGPRRPFLQYTETSRTAAGVDALVLWARPIPGGAREGPLENYSPALALEGGRAILASSYPLLREVLATPPAPPGPPAGIDRLEIDPLLAADVLAANAERLSAALVLRAGLAKIEADRELEIWLTALRALGRVEFSIADPDRELTLRLRIGTDR